MQMILIISCPTLIDAMPLGNTTAQAKRMHPRPYTRIKYNEVIKAALWTVSGVLYRVSIEAVKGATLLSPPCQVGDEVGRGACRGEGGIRYAKRLAAQGEDLPKLQEGHIFKKGENMLKPNPVAFGVAAALCVGLISGCGGGGSKDESIPDLASQNGQVEEPQIPIRNAAARTGIRKLPPIPADRLDSIGGFNAILQLLMHNPAWMQKAVSKDLQDKFGDLEEYRRILLFVHLFRNGSGLEKAHAGLLELDFDDASENEQLAELLAALTILPVPSNGIEQRLARGETTFVIADDEKFMRFDKLPAQERIIGVARYDGARRTAYLKKGADWFGTDEEKFTKVNEDYLKRLGQDGNGKIFAVSYSAA